MPSGPLPCCSSTCQAPPSLPCCSSTCQAPSYLRVQARDAFKAMLDEYQVPLRSTWEQALKLVINDFR